MATVNIGDIISFKHGKKNTEGTVTGIRENSVLVQYGYSKTKGEPLITIVNHKHYKIKSPKN